MLTTREGSSPAWVMLLALLVWAPLPLGSNRAWAVAALAILLLGTLTATLASTGFRAVSGATGRHAAAGSPWPLGAAWWSVGLLVAHAALVAAQLLELPARWRETLVPGGDVWPTVAWPTVSIDPFATRQYLLVALSCTAAFLLVVLLARTAARVKLLLWVLLCSGVLQTVVGTLFFSADGEFRYLFNSFVPGTRVTGTFANPDHLAGYIELCFAAGLGLMLAYLGAPGAVGSGWRGRVVGALRFIQSVKMLVRLLLIVLVICLVMTHSRMGNAAFFVALLIVGALCALRSKALRRPALWLVFSVLVVDVLVIGQWVGLDKVMARLAATPTHSAGQTAWRAGEASPWREESIEERVQAARYALAMVPVRPVLGFGGGSFYTAFPPFKGPHRLGFYDHAHNDYVEIAADTGLLGLSLLMVLAAASVWRAARRLGDDGDPLARGVAATVLMASGCLGLHSLVDFNLQIPANALTFTVILALAWCTPMPAPARRGGARVKR